MKAVLAGLLALAALVLAGLMFTASASANPYLSTTRALATAKYDAKATCQVYRPWHTCLNDWASGPCRRTSTDSMNCQASFSLYRWEPGRVAVFGLFNTIYMATRSNGTIRRWDYGWHWVRIR